MTFAKSLTAATLALGLSGVGASAASVTEIVEAVNIFTSGVVTGGAPLTVDAQGPVAITDAVELPGFAFGVYNVDAAASRVTLEFARDPSTLGIAQFDASTVDQYYFEFDRPLGGAVLSADSNPNFAATVELVAPGATASSVGAFVAGAPTAFTFENGGFLLSIGEGADLTAAGVGATLSVEVSAVPAPASLPMLMAGVAGLGLLRRRASV